jgi:NAD(P)-dependent dehydrogenase (short-subunit alcohol dehydrogenase family)
MLDKTTFITHSIELLINNAGVAEHENFGQWTQQAFINSFTINTIAPALLTQTLSTLLSKPSKVIQLSSGLASLHENLNPLEGFDSYSMSKASLNMMTKRLSVKLIEREVAVYAISPGWVQTRMGGEEATSNVTDAVKALTSTIENLSLTESGFFFDEHGNKLPW